MMLAADGWHKASKKALKNGHAKHIHANCDCTYAVRFDGKSTVEGYDPDYYKAIYDDADGNTWNEKMNSIRRKNYAANKDKINAQKRAAYRARTSNNLQVTEGRGIMNVDTGGQRNEKPLTPEQVNECKDYAVELGMPRDRIAYSEEYWTSYNPEFDILLIGTDAYPTENPTSANGRLSHRAAIAHEITGHREAALRGRTNFPKDDVRDEAQASIRAARFAPGLTEKERMSLREDAIERLRKRNMSIQDIIDELDIWEP